MAFDSLWAALTTDEQRTSFGDTQAPIVIARQYQHALVATGRADAALERAEASRARSLEVLLAQQRVERRRKHGSTATLPPPSPVSDGEGLLLQQVDVATATKLARDLRSAVVYFSQVEQRKLLAWVIRSQQCAGGERALVCEQMEMPEGLSYLVELTRLAAGVRARDGVAGDDSARRHRPGARDAGTMGASAEPSGEEVMRAARDGLGEALAKALTELVKVGAKAAVAPPASTLPANRLESLSLEELAALPQEELLPLLRLDVDELPCRAAGALLMLREHVLEQQLKQWYARLIAPLEASLAGEERLLIIPDQELFALPFAALLDDEGKHLIERYTLSVAPSLGTVLKLQERARDAPQRMGCALVAGVPDFPPPWAFANGVRLKELEGAREEGRSLSTLLAEHYEEAIHLEGSEATKAAVKAQVAAADLVHCATHGAPDAVYFSGRSEEEATLSMGEVQQELRLKARLVVLSECNSLRGHIGAEGVVGITRAFLVAGAQTVVASLWSVPDLATRDLMSLFYAHWLPGGGAEDDAAKALQGAMVEMVRQKRAVKKWAAFVAYGMS